MGTGPSRVYRPDLSEHYILIHPGRRWGLVKWGANRKKAMLQTYRFDEDGDLRVGQRQWHMLETDSKGPFFARQRVKAYLHDFIKPLPNPYA